MKRLSKKRLALLTLCVCSAIANSGFAAETGDLDVYGGDEFVVTATRTKLEAKEVPVAAEVITEQKIKDLGAYSVQDALRLAANVDVQDNGMTGNQVMLRGNSTMHTLILVDGKRMAAENTGSSMNAYELKRINIADVERIEVIRGNGSALYGSDAMGGVINIITKSPDKSRTTIDMHTGTKDEAMNFSYSSGKEGKLSFKLGGGIEKIRKIDTGLYDSYSQSSMTKVITRTDASTTNMYGTRRFLDAGLKYDFDEDHNLEFDMSFMREQLKSNTYNSMATDYTTGMAVNPIKMALAKAEATDPSMVPGSPRYEAMKAQMMEAFNVTDIEDAVMMMGSEVYPRLQNNIYDNNRSAYSLTYNGKDGRHDYNVRAYFSELRKEGTSHYTNLLNNNSKMVDFDHNNYKQFVVEGKDSWTMDEHNVLTFGAEYKKDIMDGTHLKTRGSKQKDITIGNITKPSSEVSSETGALYLQDELRIGEKLLIVPAVRVDHHDSFGTHTSPKIGATYSLSNNSRVKVNWGKGYRAPTLYELYAQMEKTGMAPFTVNVIGNPDLEPEKSTNFDISFEAEKGKANTKLSYYHNDVENMIDGTSEMIDGQIFSNYFNRGDVEISGVEFEVGYNFDQHWSVKANYNYLDATDKETGERLTYRARQNGLVQLAYSDAKENPLTVILYNKFYIDYRQGNDAPLIDNMGKVYRYQNDYTFSTTGLLVNKQINKNLRIYGGVENIFDKKFAYDTFHTYAIDGRMWRVGAEMTF